MGSSPTARSCLIRMERGLQKLGGSSFRMFSLPIHSARRLWFCRTLPSKSSPSSLSAWWVHLAVGKAQLWHSFSASMTQQRARYRLVPVTTRHCSAPSTSAGGGGKWVSLGRSRFSSTRRCAPTFSMGSTLTLARPSRSSTCWNACEWLISTSWIPHRGRAWRWRSARGVASFRAGRNSGWRSAVPSSGTPRCCSWTRRRAPWTRRASASCSRHSRTPAEVAPPSLSLTVCRRSLSAISSWWPRMVSLWSKARTQNSWNRRACTSSSKRAAERRTRRLRGP
mmetsp:Transcript_134539/g.335690  ORF Transcript_134539/g.335690 Transcript_134539/m.335690 type:complete len:281 (+) Transcript_134539:3247-4089(+)